MNRKLVLTLTLTLLIGTLNVAFNVQRAKASGTIYIRADGSIDPPTAPIQRDGDLYTLSGNINTDTDGIIVQRNNLILDGSGYIVQGTRPAPNQWSGVGIYLSERINVTVLDIEIKSFMNGVDLLHGSSCRIRGNKLTDNYVGIIVINSSDNTISENSLANNSCGILFQVPSSYNNSIIGNNITANGYDGGIRLRYSLNNAVYGNNIADTATVGISLEWASGNNISSNNIMTNNATGIVLDSSSNNSIVGNNITANNYSGIYLTGSSNNSVYHNNLIDNTRQVYSSESAYANVWDDGYPSGGNYWSDYNGADANHDGIGDTAYVIDANNIDHYPLMVPTVIPEFPLFLILALIMMATLLAVMVCTRKNKIGSVM